MSSWLEQIIQSTAEAESPERYHYWSSLAAVAAVVKKNVFLDRYMYTLYPNIYVLLVGKSGMRKGNPVTLCKKLVQETKATRIIVGRGTIQAKIKELGKAHSTPDGGVLKNAAGFLVSGELDSFFIKDPDAMTILTDLYDTHAHEPDWVNSTKTQGIDTLKEPCLTLLGGTNEEHFRSAIVDKDVKGGFIARTLIVFEQKRRVINDLLDRPAKVPVIKELACYLREVAKLKGEFTLNAGAREVYRPWYKDISTAERDDPTGTLERIGDTVLKVAMLISLTRDLSLEVTKNQMEQAISDCMDCLDGMRYVTLGTGSSTSSEVPVFTAQILKFLIDQPGYSATKKKILNRFWRDGIDVNVLGTVMETLMQAGAVDPHTMGADVLYVMKQTHVDAYLKFKREIN